MSGAERLGNGGRPPRAATAAVWCPFCKAGPHKPCVNARGMPQMHHHHPRVQRYRNGLYGPVPPVDGAAA